jgi:DNA-binding FadR family transcriptional regulator
MMESKQAPAPIVRRKLSDDVVERLLGEIENGRWGAGDKLPPERTLMEEYGVGRPSIREAMQRLASMGLVEISHGERATVKAMDARNMLEQIDRSARHLLLSSPNTLEHLKEARLMFEAGMVRVAAAKASKRDIETLSACVDRLEQSAGEVEEFVRADIDFHIAIASVSGNPIYSALSESMLNWLAEFHQELLRVPGAEQVTIREHRRILKQISAHDEAAAARAMADHLTRANKEYQLP